VDGQPPAGHESLGGSIGPGRRSSSRPLDLGGKQLWLLADASNVRLLNASERHLSGGSVNDPRLCDATESQLLQIRRFPCCR
jgi:hypothetical protein